jgi:hypothetical protein
VPGLNGILRKSHERIGGFAFSTQGKDRSGPPAKGVSVDGDLPQQAGVT